MKQNSLIAFCLYILYINSIKCTNIDSPVKQFNLTTSTKSGTLLGSIQIDEELVQMKPPFYIVPIQPEDQDIFNKYIRVDLENGNIYLNSKIDRLEFSLFKFSALSINQGSALSLLINIIDDLGVFTQTTSKKNRILSEEIQNCLDIDLNTQEYTNQTKLDLDLVDRIVEPVVYSCFQLSPEFSLNFTLNSEFIPKNIQKNFKISRFISLDCNSEFKLLNNQFNKNLFDFFNINLNSLEEYSDFTLADQVIIEFKCKSNKIKNIFNFKLKNFDSFKFLLIKNLNILFLAARLETECQNQTVLNNWTPSPTTISLIVTNLTKINKLSFSFKLFLISIICTVFILLIIFYLTFMAFRRMLSVEARTSSHMSYDDNSLFSYKSKSQLFSGEFLRNCFRSKSKAKSINSALSTNTLDTRTSVLLDKDLFTVQKSNFHNYFDLTANQNEENMFSFSTGYLNQMGISVLEDLRNLVDTNGNSNGMAQNNQGQTVDVNCLRINSQNVLRNDYMDVSMGRWCSLLDWKVEFRSISNVLDELAQLE